MSRSLSTGFSEGKTIMKAELSDLGNDKPYAGVQKEKEINASDASTCKIPQQVFTLEEKQGEMMMNSGCLAHCVGRDLRMGRGISAVFGKRFGGTDELRKQNIKVGGVGVLDRDGRYVYYLVTKDKYFQKPTYESQLSSLRAMKAHCVSHSVRRLAMPRIGCGLDLLQWQQVRQDIKDVFEDTDIAITVYSLD